MQNSEENKEFFEEIQRIKNLKIQKLIEIDKENIKRMAEKDENKIHLSGNFLQERKKALEIMGFSCYIEKDRPYCDSDYLVVSI